MRSCHSVSSLSDENNNFLQETELTYAVFEDKDKAKEVAAAVHKKLDDDDDKKQDTAHLEIQETKSAA